MVGNEEPVSTFWNLQKKKKKSIYKELNDQLIKKWAKYLSVKEFAIPTIHINGMKKLYYKSYIILDRGYNLFS